MRKLRFFFAACLAIASGAAFAQNVVYTQGNAKIVQLSDGWQILCGESVVAHGNGTLDLDNLPPAFRDFLDIYAQQKELVADAAKSDDEPVYGPLISTQWNQGAPYNNEFPIVDGNGHAVTGCTVTATAQILNYYKYCLPLNLSGTHYTTESSSSIESPYISNITKVEGGRYDGMFQYDYNYSYTPDFEKINADNEQLSKFFLAIAFAQNVDFGLSATSGSNSNIDKWILYGYDMLLFNNEAKSTPNYRADIEDLTTNDYISAAIKRGTPVNIRGAQRNDGSHAFIIDGCHGNEFHINYGWGGHYDGWFTTTRYPEEMRIFIAHPADTNAVFMQSDPKYLNIKGDGGFNKKIELVQSDSSQLEYKQKSQLKLDAGVYEFCFEYADGSTIAPYTDSVIRLSDKYSKQGRFVSSPAQIEIPNSYNVDFLIKQNKAEIAVVCADYRIPVTGRVTDINSQPIEGARVAATTEFVTTDADGRYSIEIEKYSTTNLTAYHSDYIFSTQRLQNLDKDLSEVNFKGVDAKITISGQVTDRYSNPLEGVCVTTAATGPVHVDELKKESTRTTGYILQTPSRWYTNSFVATQPYIMQVDFKVWKQGSPNGLIVAILDNARNVLWQKALPDNVVLVGGRWTQVTIDGMLKVEQGREYYIGLSVADYNGSDRYIFYIDDNNEMQYHVRLCAARFVNSDENGNYSLTIDRYFTGTLRAFSGDNKNFNAQLFNNLLDNVADKNFVEEGTDRKNDYLPDSIMVMPPFKTNYFVGDTFDNTGMIVYACYAGELKQAVTDYELSAIDFESEGEKCLTVTYRGKTAGFKMNIDLRRHSITYEVDDKVYAVIDSVVYGTPITAIAAPTKEGYTFSGWSQMPETMPDKNIVVTGSFTVNKHSITYKVDDEVYFFVDGVIYGTPITAIAAPTKEGCTFSDWSQIPETMPDEDIVVTGSFIANKHTITYKVDDEVYFIVDSVIYGTAITAIAAPTKEGYTFSGWSQIPETMPDEDIVVTGSFIANKHTITYKVDDVVYFFVDSVIYGTPITAIAAPTKEGYTFSGWSQISETMPDMDVAVTGSFIVNKYTITYRVDNETLLVVEDVAFGTVIVPIDAPIKEGYMFTGWSLEDIQDYIPKTMPYNDIILVGSFIKTGETTAVELYEAESVRVWASGRAIVVENANDEVFVYDAMGRLVGRDVRCRHCAITVSHSGVYVIKIGGAAQRVFVE